MPTLSAVVAEHPDILSTIVCCLADGGPANVLPLASVCRWTCNAFAPPKPAPNLQWHPPQNLQDNLQVNDRGWSAPPPNMSMAPTNPLLPPNMATHGLLPPNMSMAPMPNGLDLLTMSTATWPNGQPIEWKNWN